MGSLFKKPEDLEIFSDKDIERRKSEIDLYVNLLSSVIDMYVVDEVTKAYNMGEVDLWFEYASHDTWGERKAWLDKHGEDFPKRWRQKISSESVESESIDSENVTTIDDIGVESAIASEFINNYIRRITEISAVRAYNMGEIEQWIDHHKSRTMEEWDEWKKNHSPEYKKRWDVSKELRIDTMNQ